MNTGERRGEILKILQTGGSSDCSKRTGRTFWGQPPGDRAGSGGDPCIHTGNPLHNKRLCHGAGQQLYP